MMEQVVAELERILALLAAPAALGGEQLALLNGQWVLAISQLQRLSSEESDGSFVADAEKSDLSQRLQTIISQLPEVTTLLQNHKSEVAGQLFTENRRVLVMRQGGYDALVRRPQLLHQRA
ncbi:MAG: hypothetical protein HQL67_05225 [Magnetococcales bacterium]|nr:hypothetical protein [Magnetococcales bacterium]